MSKVKSTLWVLAVLTSTLSAISFVQTISDLGLIPVLRDIISFYRSVASLALAWPAKAFGLELPQVLIDIWVVSFVGAGAYVLTDGIEKCRALRRFELEKVSRAWKIALFLIFGFSGLGLAIVFGGVHPLTYVDDFHEEPLDLMKGAARNVLWVCFGLAAFYVVNAFAPSRS